MTRQDKSPPRKHNHYEGMETASDRSTATQTRVWPGLGAPAVDSNEISRGHATLIQSEAPRRMPPAPRAWLITQMMGGGVLEHAPQLPCHKLLLVVGLFNCDWAVKINDILVPPSSVFRSKKHIHVQGDHSGGVKPPADIITKVLFKYMGLILILKQNLCFEVNRRFVTT